MSPTFISHDSTNSYNLTIIENVSKNAGDDINTRNVDFRTYLIDWVVADGAAAENSPNTIVTGPIAKEHLGFSNDANIDRNSRWINNTQKSAPQNSS